MVREFRESDRGWAEEYMKAEFGGALQARRGVLIDALALPGFVAEADYRPVGTLMYRRDEAECELVFVAAFERREGIGTALLGGVRARHGRR